MRLDDEAVRVATRLRLGLEICALHQCRCGAQVDGVRPPRICLQKSPGQIDSSPCIERSGQSTNIRLLRHDKTQALVARALSAADRTARAYADLAENALRGSL